MPAVAVGGQCSYCLLSIGLSSVGAARSSVGAGGAGNGAAAADRFARQGVLQVFGDYELESEIARGGMGVVYRARQRSLDRVVAIKMILAGQLATPESVLRFQLEAQAAARLQHPGIVPIFEIGEHETQHYFSMELVDGASLAECLDDFRLQPGAAPAERRQQERCIAELLARVARALDFAHQRGVLHRDLKPSNILIDERGQPRLTDFGLAKLTGREGGGLTLSAAVLGTPGYLAPEQASGSGEVTTAADVYGLGATLYELLTSRPPFVGATAVATMMMAVAQPPVPPRQLNPAVHRDLDTIVLRCLEKAPERRYHTAASVADELERFLAGEPIRARPVSRVEHVARWCRRNPALAAVLGLLALAIAGGVGTAVWQWRQVRGANGSLTRTVADLRWGTIDDMLQQGQAARALATVAAVIREDPADPDATTFAMSLLQQRRFPVPAAPQVRHPGSAALSVARIGPDGDRIATASFDGSVRLWDARTSAELVPSLSHGSPVNWVEFSPDGRMLASGSRDGAVRLWDVRTGRPLGAPMQLGEPVVRVQFSPDGRRLLAHGRSTAALFDAGDGHRVGGPVPSVGTIVAARFLSDGTYFVARTAGAGSSVGTWDVQSGRALASLPTGPIQDADLAGGRAAVVQEDGQAWLADFPSGARRRDIPTDGGLVQRVAFSPRGDRLAVVGLDHWARVFDAADARPVTGEFPHYYVLNGAAFLSDGQRLLTWGNDALAQVWDVDANRPDCEPMRHAHRVVYAELATTDRGERFLTTESHQASHASEAVAESEAGTGAAQLWDVLDRHDTGDRFYGTLYPGFDTTRFSPDGRLVAIATTTDDSDREEITVLDADTRAPVCPPLVVRGAAWGMLFTPDGSRLVTTTASGQVTVWSMPGGRVAAGPASVPRGVKPAEIAPDGRTFATGSPDGLVRLWDTASCRIVHEMRHGADIHSLAFSPDGTLLASAGADHVTRLWGTATGAPVRALLGHQNEVMTVFFSPDGRRLVTGSFDFTARIWDAATGRTTAVLPHRGEVLDVAFSPDGRYVATGSRDRTAVIWDADTGLPRGRSLLHEQAVRNVRFSPDGTRLYTMDFRALRAWDVATGHPLTVRIPHRMGGGTGFQASGLRFDLSPDGQAVLVGADSRRVERFHLPAPPPGAPPWFPDLLEAVAGERLTAGVDLPEFVPPDRFVQLAAQLARSTDGDFYTRWARQWLAGSGPPDRSTPVAR
jgi:WD40 repeat protein/predicted Ser/Thr protein kinase